jgi:SAM-dependent methyltransferase
VLDIGAGTGHIAEALHRLGFAAVASDILDINFVPLPFVLADGAHLPFASASFDVSLLITMLHHTPAAAHIGLLQEATRVLRPGGRLLIIEDVYHGAFERKMTHIMDSMMNAEFVGHPHSNRSLAEWRALLQKLHLSLVHGVEYTAWYGPFRMRHALLVVAR